jgi:alkylated DNA nucleotide flippase Atl1
MSGKAPLYVTRSVEETDTVETVKLTLKKAVPVGRVKTYPQISWLASVTEVETE